jgi:phosphoglycerol geranylgeranyltransferase
MFKGHVERYIRRTRSARRKMLAVLIDPESFSAKTASEVAKRSEKCGASVILVGGSTICDRSHLDRVTRDIVKNITIPVILFPNNVTGITRYADAILFMSLMNSTNHYFMYGAQALGATTVLRYGLEVLPTAYIIVGGESSASIMGYAKPIPEDKPELVSAYALAAWYLGMRFLYLEAGSGSFKPLSPEVVQRTRERYPGTIFAGGGIRTAEEARGIASAGADVIVVGNLVETEDFEPKLKSIAEALRSVGKREVR